MEALPERERCAVEEALGHLLGDPEGDTLLEVEVERREEVDRAAVRDREGQAVVLREGCRVEVTVPTLGVLEELRDSLGLLDALRGAEMEKVMMAEAVLVVVVLAVMLGEVLRLALAQPLEEREAPAMGDPLTVP